MPEIKNEEEYQELLAEYKKLANRLQGRETGKLAQQRDSMYSKLQEYRSRIYTLGVPVVPQPCPFCNSKELHISLDRRRGYYVYCKDCSASGPYSKQQEPAVRVWNERK